MYLIQILLPLYDNEGQRLPQQLYKKVRKELVDDFGGLTAHVRAPATGLWQPEEEEPTVRDEIVIYEVMVEALDRDWWRSYRAALCERFRQEALVVRVSEIELL